VAERLKSAVHKHLEGFALRVFLKKDGESLRLGLWDNGCEVSDSTARSNGGSLGLNLVRALLKQARGELEINQFDGVLFTVTLPESIFVDQSRGPAHRSSL
jgi:two-component sensor histidine kinase